MIGVMELTQEKQWTTNELAAAAGVNVSYIRRLLLDEKLHGQKIGRDWIIPDSEAKRWLVSRKGEVGEEK